MADPKITITAVDNTKAGFASVAGGLDKLKASAATVTSTFSKIAGPITAAVATLGVATAGITASVGKALETGDQLFKLSQKVGISVETLSELRFAADLSGVSLETLQKGLKDLSLVLVQANDASSKEAQLLKQLGVTAREPEQALRQVADAFSKLPDGATKTALAVELFKKAGQDLIPLLNGGSAALDAAGFSARRLGLAFTTDAARAAEQFNDNMLKLKTGAESLGISLTSKLVASMAQFTGDLVKAKEEGIKWRGVLDGVLGTTLELAKNLPLIGGAIDRVADANARRVAEEQASIARRTSSGVIRRPAESVDPDAEARLTCTISGGTWDARNRRCVARASATSAEKPLTLDEVLARNAAKRDEVFRERNATQGRANEEALQKALDAESARALAGAQRRDEATAAGTAEYRKTQELAQAYRDLASPLESFRRQLAEIDKLRGLPGGLNEEDARAAESAVLKVMAAVGQGAKETKGIAEELGLTFSSAFEDAIVKGEKARDVIKGLGQDVARILIRKSVTEPIASGISDIFKKSGGGSILSSIGSSIGKLFGFASGGSFTVAGGGGTDSQLVAFRATPGERVTVETPAQQRGGGGMTVINQFVDISGEIRQQIANAMPTIISAAASQVADMRRRGVAV